MCKVERANLVALYGPESGGTEGDANHLIICLNQDEFISLQLEDDGSEVCSTPEHIHLTLSGFYLFP